MKVDLDSLKQSVKAAEEAQRDLAITMAHMHGITVLPNPNIPEGSYVLMCGPKTFDKVRKESTDGS